MGLSLEFRGTMPILALELLFHGELALSTACLERQQAKSAFSTACLEKQQERAKVSAEMSKCQGEVILGVGMSPWRHLGVISVASDPTC